MLANYFGTIPRNFACFTYVWHYGCVQ